MESLTKKQLESLKKISGSISFTSKCDLKQGVKDSNKEWYELMVNRMVKIINQ